MDTGKVVKETVIKPTRETYVPNPMSPSKIREIERKITEKAPKPEKVPEKVPN